MKTYTIALYTALTVAVSAMAYLDWMGIPEVAKNEYAKGQKAGRMEGYRRGLDDGEVIGTVLGEITGKKAGIAEGYVNGHDAGKLEGKLEILNETLRLCRRGSMIFFAKPQRFFCTEVTKI